MNMKTPREEESHTPRTDEAHDDQSHDVAALHEAIAAKDRAIAALTRSRLIGDALRDAGAIDLESARLLIEHARAEAGDEGRMATTEDIAAEVRSLRDRKPFLFATSARSSHSAAAGGAVSSPHIEPRADDHVQHAAAEAHASGKLSDLLRYMRVRRRYVQRAE